jgi:two-component system, NtrC family, response regulator HydG
MRAAIFNRPRLSPAPPFSNALNSYRPCLAHDVASANRYLNQDSAFNLVLLDMKLPDGDGSQGLRTARHNHPTMPIVVITGYRDEFEPRISECLLQEAKAVLSKPLEVPAVLATVQQLAPLTAM